jgi:hypothetical protein
LDYKFSRQIDNFTDKALQSLQQFDIFFDQLENNPTLKQTIQSETSRLNDLKNCEYHRSKIKQFLGDYNRCVEENMKLKEQNYKLARKNANL